MKKALTPEEALFRAAALCSTGERCCRDIAEKLTQWGIAAADAGRIIEHLADGGYIDEERYCRSFVSDKLRFDRWGRIKIRYALAQKGIGNSLIQKYLSDIDEEQYRAALGELLAKKRAALSGGEPEVRVKLMRFAASRGFEPDAIYAVLGEMSAEKYDCDD